MSGAELDLITTILQIGGTPALVGLVLYMAWKNGPERQIESSLKKLDRLGHSIDDLRRTMAAHREDAMTRVSENRERLVKLETIARECERRKHRRESQE